MCIYSENKICSIYQYVTLFARLCAFQIQQQKKKKKACLKAFGAKKKSFETQCCLCRIVSKLAINVRLISQSDFSNKTQKQ